MFRNVPPLRALRAFEAAARLLSFTEAAEELHVTQAAVSLQIKHLEELLGVQLFRRLNRRLVLTEEGRIYLPEVREGLERLAAATARMARRHRQGHLTVSVLPSFASRWLIPRLWRFQKTHPDIQVRISAFEWLVDFDKDDVDLAIRYGAGRWPGLAAELLFEEEVFPVCSPELLGGDPPLEEPPDLAHHTLLHDDYTREDWRSWLKAAGVSGIDPEQGLSFSHSTLMLQAAERGLGVALGRTPLVRDELARGTLVRPFEAALPGDFAYYLVYPPHTAEFPRIRAFRQWLLEEAAAADG